MSGQPVDPTMIVYLKLFKLCKLGLSFDDLGVPKGERKKVIEVFLHIIDRINEEQARERRKAELDQMALRLR